MGYLAGHIAVNGGEGLFDLIGRLVMDQNIVSSQSADMCNTAAHLPCANNAYGLDRACHVSIPSYYEYITQTKWPG